MAKFMEKGLPWMALQDSGAMPMDAGAPPFPIGPELGPVGASMAPGMGPPPPTNLTYQIIVEKKPAAKKKSSEPKVEKGVTSPKVKVPTPTGEGMSLKKMKEKRDYVLGEKPKKSLEKIKGMSDSEVDMERRVEERMRERPGYKSESLEQRINRRPGMPAGSIEEMMMKREELRRKLR